MTVLPLRPFFSIRSFATMRAGPGALAERVLPALLVFYIRSGVEESPVWRAGQRRKTGDREGLWRSIRRQR